MIKITLITIGKLKEKYFSEASLEYEKRLGGYSKLIIKELTPSRLPSDPTEGDVSAALKDEGERILKEIPDGSAVIPLCIEGKKLTSEQLSEYISKLQISGISHICFIIGGSYGIADFVKSKADLKLSMSDMTFPHRLARIMLLEQVYRAFKIQEGGTYHK